MPIRQNDDKATLRTDEQSDPSTMYSSAEKIFDPANQPSQVPQNTGTVKKGGAATSGDKQTHQQETSEKEDPSLAVHDADPADI